jgi:hypothetical protein
MDDTCICTPWLLALVVVLLLVLLVAAVLTGPWSAA